MNENKTWLSDIIKMMSEEFNKFMETEGNKVKDNLVEVIKNLMPIYEEFVSHLKQVISDVKLASHIVIIETYNITLDGIKDAARENMVSGATETVALKNVTENEKTVWLTYSDNRELLPQEKNKYIVIKGKNFDDEVENLFEKNNLIILK